MLLPLTLKSNCSSHCNTLHCARLFFCDCDEVMIVFMELFVVLHVHVVDVPKLGLFAIDCLQYII